ncbi:hypothetical protein D3C77_529710 [compost metagenome]
MAKKEEDTKQKANAARFTKEQFVQSGQWQGVDRDILSVVLEDHKTYTLAQAKQLVEQFMIGEVK